MLSFLFAFSFDLSGSATPSRTPQKPIRAALRCCAVRSVVQINGGKQLFKFALSDTALHIGHPQNSQPRVVTDLATTHSEEQQKYAAMKTCEP
jgi:hypothetical protein